jgi:peptidoglycan/xylan/chitin deacetylase (PgdA/CDA1 family)
VAQSVSDFNAIDAKLVLQDSFRQAGIRNLPRHHPEVIRITVARSQLQTQGRTIEILTVSDFHPPRSQMQAREMQRVRAALDRIARTNGWRFEGGRFNVSSPRHAEEYVIDTLDDLGWRPKPKGSAVGIGISNSRGPCPRCERLLRMRRAAGYRVNARWIESGRILRRLIRRGRG